jgi:hypothetical protein
MAAIDDFAAFSKHPTAPLRSAAAVTPSNTVELAHVTRGIIVGVAGDVKCTLANGDVVVFPALVAGIVHPIAAKIIWDTGTNATSIVAAY